MQVPLVLPFKVCMIFGCPDRDLFTACIKDARNIGYSKFNALYLNSKVSGNIIYRSENIPDKALPNFTVHLGYTPKDPEEGSFVVTKKWAIACSGKVRYIGEDNSKDDGGNIFTWALDSFESKIPLAGHKEMLALQSTFNRMQGSFSCWLYHFPTKQIYIYRCGAPLYYNTECHEFCSVKSKDDFALKSGTLYKYKLRSIEPFLKVNVKEDPLSILE